MLTKKILLFFIIITFNITAALFGNEKIGDRMEPETETKFINEIQAKDIIGNSGIIDGYFVEKNKSYELHLEYNMKKKYIKMILYKLTKKEVIFDVERKDDLITYNTLSGLFPAMRIQYLLNDISFMLEKDTNSLKLYTTKDDQYAGIDDQNFLYKFDDGYLVKKSKGIYTAKYFIDSGLIKRIELCTFKNKAVIVPEYFAK